MILDARVQHHVSYGVKGNNWSAAAKDEPILNVVSVCVACNGQAHTRARGRENHQSVRTVCCAAGNSAEHTTALVELNLSRTAARSREWRLGRSNIRDENEIRRGESYDVTHALRDLTSARRGF